MDTKKPLRLVIDRREVGGGIIGLTLVYVEQYGAWEVVVDEVRYVVTEVK